MRYLSCAFGRFQHRNNILRTQRVSSDHTHVPRFCVHFCSASAGYGVFTTHPQTVMDQQYPRHMVSNVDGIQLRAGVFPSMLLDTLPSEEVLPIEAMGGDLPCEPMALV